MKHFLRTAVVGAVAVVCNVPSVAARPRHLLGRQSSPTERTLLGEATFHEDIVTDLTEHVETWREEPGPVEEADSEWTWRSGYQPCSKGSKKSGSRRYLKSSKGSKKGASYACEDEEGAEGPDGGSQGGSDGPYPDGGGGGGVGGDGSIPGDGSVPGDGSIPGDGSVPGDGSSPGDGSTPDDGSNPDDGATVDPLPPPFVGDDAPMTEVGDDIFVNTTTSRTCDAIESGIKPEMAEGDSETLYTVTFTFDYQRPPLLRDGVVGILDSVSPVLDLWVAGCEERAYNLADQVLEQDGRRLNEGSLLWVKSFFSPEGDDPCASLEAGQTCTDKFAADFEIISNDVSSDDVIDRIVKAFVEFADLINKLGRGSLNFDPSTVSVGETPRGVVGADNSELELQDGSASIPMVIGAVAGGLAFILLLVLVARRNNDSDDERISHLKLEEDNEDALLREYASTGSMRSEEDHYERRNVTWSGKLIQSFLDGLGIPKTANPEMIWMHTMAMCTSAVLQRVRSANKGASKVFSSFLRQVF